MIGQKEIIARIYNKKIKQKTFDEGDIYWSLYYI